MVNWDIFKQNFIIYLIACGQEESTDKQKIPLFLNFIGMEGLGIFNTFKVDMKTLKYKNMLELFDIHFKEHVFVLFERFKFFSLYQKSDESIDQFTTEKQ